MSKDDTQLLLALSSDLKRVALNAARGSMQSAQVFLQEAQEKANQMKGSIPPYLTRAIDNISPANLSEQSLVCSILSRNLALR